MTHNFEDAISALTCEPMFEEMYPEAMSAVYAALRLAAKVQAGEVKCVPVEPTDDMQEAIWLAAQLQNANTQYKAMIKAAPEYDWGVDNPPNQ